MPKALWNETVIADAPLEQCEMLEGNLYFPPGAVNYQYLQPSGTHTIDSWKGSANYFDVVVNGEVNKDAAWYYPSPADGARQIAGYVAFWRGVRVEP